MPFSLYFSPTPLITAPSPLSKPSFLVPYYHTLHAPKSPLCSSMEHALTHQGKQEAFDLRPEDSQTLPLGLRRDAMPSHVAVIMDGNRRWARLRDLPVRSGYEAGVESLRKIVEICCKWGIKVLSVFAFSSDNWFRPKVEVEFLMSLFERGMQEDTGIFFRENIRISVIGDLTKLPKALQELMVNLEEATKNNTLFQLIVAELETNCTEFPHPDLLIRTSGEFRISNFMLWQLAYTELYFAQSLWPDFGEAEFLKALLAFQQRQRRYGV
ncbi:hypothetical protein V6Z12_A09G188300 [Gossypium hirsutum]